MILSFDGMVVFQFNRNKKNIEELHDYISEHFKISKVKILEVSTKSKLDIGKSLSSFNLKITYNGISYPLECIYQTSKVFKHVFGEYQIKEALNMDSKSAKKDCR